MKKTLFLFLMLVCTLWGYAREIVSNSGEAFPQNSDYTVEINRGDGNWETLMSHNAIVFWGTQNMTFAKFEADFTTPVEVRVTRNSGTFNRAEIRPKSYFIDYQKVDERTLTFTLDRPRKVSVEFDGDRWNNLFLFADETDTNVPDKDDDNVLWYGPGVHEVGKIELQSGQTLYLHPDALVYGYVIASDAQNVRICGRGILDGSKENMDYGEGKVRYSQLLLVNCSDVTVEDLVFRNTPTWNIVTVGCDNIHFDGIKEIGSNANSDGFDIVSSSNILIENTMQRNKDDNISVKAIDLEVNTSGLLDGLRGNKIERLNVTESHNIRMRNCVLWADEAHNMLIGPDVNGTAVSGIYFENIDVLQNRQNDDVYPGVMAVMIADQGVYSDIHWKGIRVEDIDAGQVISLTYQNAYAPLGYGKSLRNVTFENISYNGTKASPSRILGLDASHTVEGVTITNYRINGVPVTDAGSANITTNSFTSGITFETGTGDNPTGMTPVSRSAEQQALYGTPLEYDYFFFSDRFSYVDPLQSIRVVALPQSGSLVLAGQPVVLHQEIGAGELGNLRYDSSTGFIGRDSWSWIGVSNGIESASATISIEVENKSILSMAIAWETTLGNDLNNFYERSANLTIDGSNANLLDDYARVNRTSDTEEYVVVRGSEAFSTFDVLAYGYGPTGAKGLLRFEVSADGSAWTPVTVDDGVGEQTTETSGWYRKHFEPQVQLPEGSQLLKVIFLPSGNSWGTQMARIDLGSMYLQKEASIGTPLDEVGLAPEAVVTLSDGSVEYFPVVWDGGTPAYESGVAGEYRFAGAIELPLGYAYTGNTQATALIQVYDITQGVAPLEGTDDFMARDDEGRIVYSDGTPVPESITDFADNKAVKIGAKRYLSVENIMGDGPAATEGWKLKGEGLQDRYARLQRANESASSVTYVIHDTYGLEVEILGLAGLTNLRSSIEIAETANGIDWTPLDYRLVDTGVLTANGYYALYKAQVVSFSAGAQLVKITMRSGDDNLPSWAPQIIAVTSLPVEHAVDCDHEMLDYMGRVDQTDAKTPRFIWTGSGVRTRFYGTELTALFTAENAKVAVWVDGERQGVTSVTAAQVPVSTGACDEGWHEVVFRKASRVENGDLYLSKIICDGELALPEEAELKLEFYGNSVAEGYAAGAIDESQRNNGLYDDHSCAYPCLVSEMLGADYHNISISGIALTDGAGYLPYGMQSRYRLLDPDDESSLWDFTRFVPDICVMALGINDTYATGNVNGRTWRENYRQLIHELREQYGADTRFVFTVPPMVEAEADVIQWSTTLVETLKSEGIDAYQYIFELGKVKDHPIASEQQTIAEELYRFLNEQVIADKPTSVETGKTGLSLYTVNGDRIELQTEVGDCARLYSIAGVLVRTASGPAVWDNLAQGCYVLHIDSREAGNIVTKLQIN